MFPDVGWLEVVVILLIVVIFVGPEHLPSVVKEVRAALLAARTAINNAKQQLDSGLGDEFRELSEPLSEIARLRGTSTKTALAKVLFDGDTQPLDAFDLRAMNASTVARSGKNPTDTSDPKKSAQPEPENIPSTGTSARAAFNYAELNYDDDVN